jgi:hypothetical protein
MRLKTVRTLARTMLAYDRLEAGGSIGPRSASRRRASSSDRPVGEWATRSSGVVGAVSVSEARLPHGGARSRIIVLSVRLFLALLAAALGAASNAPGAPPPAALYQTIPRPYHCLAAT